MQTKHIFAKKKSIRRIISGWKRKIERFQEAFHASEGLIAPVKLQESYLDELIPKAFHRFLWRVRHALDFSRAPQRRMTSVLDGAI